MVGEPPEPGAGEKRKAQRYRVEVTFPWIVLNAKSPSDALNIAVAEAGKYLDYVKVDALDVDFNGKKIKGVFVVNGVALVALVAQVTVLACSRVEAMRVAKAKLWKKLAESRVSEMLRSIPFTVVSCTQL